jgi:hypothetical protein
MKIQNQLLYLICTLTFSVFAQNKPEILDNKVLYTKQYYSDFFKDNGKWAWEFDVVMRRQSELGEANIFMHPLRFSIRPWIAFQYSKLARISLNPIAMFHSTARFPLESDLNRLGERELRTTLQFVQSSFAGRVNFTHRLRFESRWRGIDEPNVKHNFRFRYRMRVRVPLNTNYFYTNHTLYLCAYSELHTEFGRDYGSNFLSQSRNYIGLGFRFWDWTRVELGYLHQYNTRSNNQQIDLSRGPMVYLFMDVLSRNKKRVSYSL